MKSVGVLALQGDFDKHAQIMKLCGAKVVEIRRREHLDECEGFIMPGGESTTIIKLLKSNEIWEPLKERIETGSPLFATCAGLIILARAITNFPDQPRMDIFDIEVSRNGYGRQIASFEADLTIESLPGGPMRALFIRAPRIVSTGSEVEVLAALNESPVLVRQDNLIGATFHPELCFDPRLHQYFYELI